MSGRAAIVGASRGLGLGLVREYLDRGWSVVATTRGHGDSGLRALAAEAGERLRIVELDVTDYDAADRLAAALDGGALDLLFVSAGVLGDSESPAGSQSAEAFTQVMLTNALAPLRLIEAIGGRVAASGAVVAMTSVLGSVGDNTTGGYDVYRASKAALNTLLRCYAARHGERTVIAMHPGWVRTDMGGADAMLEVADSAKAMAGAIAARTGQAGCVFSDWEGRPIVW